MRRYWVYCLAFYEAGCYVGVPLVVVVIACGGSADRHEHNYTRLHSVFSDRITGLGARWDGGGDGLAGMEGLRLELLRRKG